MKIYKTEYSFTRPADTTAYGAGDLCANSTTAGSVEPIALNVGKGGFKLLTLILYKTDATDVANSDFDLHLYCGPKPTTAAGDNAAWSKASSPVEGYLGSVDFPIMTAGSDDASTQLKIGDTGFLEPICGYSETGNIWGFLALDSAYGPASEEVFTVVAYYEKW